MEGNIAATYTLIFRFLKQQSKNKAAEAVKKAAKVIVVLRDDVEQEGPPLEDIIKEWKAKQNTISGDADSSSEDSGSSDDSSSESEGVSSSDSSSEETSDSEREDKSESEDDDTSDSDDSVDDSDEEAKAKKSPQKAGQRDTSATLSSAGEDSLEVAKQVTFQIPEKKPSKDKDAISESDSSESDSDNSSTSSDSDSSDAETSSSSSDSSSNSDSIDEEANEKEKASPNKTKTTEDESLSSSESSSDSEDETDSESSQNDNARVAKKRKTSENGAAATTAVTTQSQEIARAPQKKEKPPPKVQERFQRVKVQNVTPELMLDNGYKARGGATNDYGQRAHRDLIVTRGAGFRKEKNKKKRGSYRGGEITMENHSIKFDF